jgi:hypothetical protein
MKTKIGTIECHLIGDTYYSDLSIGGSYLLPIFTMNKTAGMIYQQTWVKLKKIDQDYILSMVENYGKEIVNNRKTRYIDGFSGGCETLTIEPANKRYIVWIMDLVKDMDNVLSSYKKYTEYNF